jgi:putative nucleotidyltransferase with HDIG domain
MTVDLDPRLARAIEPVRAALPADELWLVGGAVRDVLLGRPLTDWDLVTTGDAEAVARTYAKAVGAPVFPLSERHGAWRVVGEEREVDITGAPDGITADLLRRDLTVNAIAVRLSDGELMAVPGALDDLEAGVLRAVSDQSFRDDPLRLLRLVRLAIELDLEIDESTIALARRDAERAAEPAGERQRAELERILLSRDPVDGLRRLDDLGLLAAVLPEVKALEGVGQNRYHHLDVLDHTLQVLDSAIDLIEHPEFSFGAATPAVAAALAEELDADTDVAMAVRWGALLHDIAKPTTRREFDNGHIGFPGHAQDGAITATAILARLRYSAAMQRCVAVLVREHLRLGFLVPDGELDPRAVHRYRVETEPWAIASVVVSLADRWSTRGTRARQRWIRRHEQLASAMALALSAPTPAPLIRGDDLAAALDVQPGPRLGRLLAQIAEEQAAGTITSADEAIAFARTVPLED